MSREINRRSFLAAGGGADAALALSPMTAGTVDDRVRCGIIGAGGRGTYLLELALKAEGVDIACVCDIAEARVQEARKIVERAGRRPPEGCGEKGPRDYLRMLERKDLDAVIIATPMPDHASMSVDALRSGKAVLSEVAAAMTLDECRSLVRAVEETGKLYMMAENVCYFRECMLILNMVQRGLFGGGFTYGECGYVHDCRSLIFNADGSLTWRGALYRDRIGNSYPTHAIGPLARWMGINRTDRFVSLVSMTSRSFGARHSAVSRFGPGSPQAGIDFQGGDTTSTLIRTEKGAVIDLRYDIASPRPHRSTVYHAVQGQTASYRSEPSEIWIESRSPSYDWEPLEKYAKEYDHPFWQKWEKDAAQTGHGGADFFVIQEFFQALRAGKASPVDVYDAVTWSSIIPLSAESIRKGSVAVEVPDFKKRTG